MSDDDKSLPPVGTLWGNVSPEQRERLPVGTVLGPPTWSRINSKLTRDAKGAWRDDQGAVIDNVGSGRPILSYPTDAGTWDEPAPAADQSPPINPHQHALKVIADHLGISLRGGPVAIADEVVAEFRRIEAERQGDAERIRAAESKLAAERVTFANADDALAKVIAIAEGRLDVALVSTAPRVNQGDVAVAAVVRLRREADDLRVALARVGKGRDSLARQVGQVVEVDQVIRVGTPAAVMAAMLRGHHEAVQEYEREIAERDGKLEARHEFRLVALPSTPHLGYVESLGAHEPGLLTPEGWEWDGSWHPVGLGVTADGVTTNRWRRNIRRVAT